MSDAITLFKIKNFNNLLHNKIEKAEKEALYSEGFGGIISTIEKCTYLDLLFHFEHIFANELEEEREL